MRKRYKALLWLFAGGVLLYALIGFSWIANKMGKALNAPEQALMAPELRSSAPPYDPIELNKPPYDPIEAVDHILEKMQFGNIAFNVPTAMNLRDTASIQLLLSLVTPMEELKRTIETEGLKEGARVQVCDRMEARLSGSNFSITAVTPEIQAISRHVITAWKWDINPKTEGKQYLHLTPIPVNEFFMLLLAEE